AFGNRGFAGTEEEAGSGATPVGTSKTASTVEHSNESTATTSVETETTAVDETQKGTAAAVPSSGSQLTDAASSSDTGNNQSQQQVASSDAAIPEKSQLATETMNGQDATVPGNPLSKFTISASGDAAVVAVDALVHQAGGSTEKTLRFSLSWSTTDDLDIGVETPTGKYVWYQNETADGGELDVDANVTGDTRTPVENVVWVYPPRRGTYTVRVNLYKRHHGNPGPVKFTLVSYVNGQPKVYNKQITSRGDTVIVCRVNYREPK
ncbi:MAG: hypothetical protein ABGZ53_18175, partial [Fuerstiella sp.]